MTTTTTMKRTPREIVENALATTGRGLVLTRDFGARFMITHVSVSDDLYAGTATLDSGEVMDVGGSLYRLGVLREIRGW